MKVVELNEGRKIEYELNGTKLDFADGTLTVNLAKYQRDSDITKTVIGDKDGNLLLIDKPDTLPEKNADGRFYVAIVEIPATEYEEVEVEGEAENEVMAAAEVADENDNAEDTTPKTHIERKAKPLDTDKVKDYGKQFRGRRICIAVRISQEQDSDGRQGYAVRLCVDSRIPPV